MLAVLGVFGLLNPYLILACVFLIGVGFAFSAPAWSALVPEVVSNDELPSAVTLGGLQLNLCGIVGPAIAAVILSHYGANWIFAVNAAGFLLVIAAIAQWKRKEKQSRLPLENFFESFVGAIRYVRYAPGIQVVLARNVLFSLFISVIPALLPVIGLKEVLMNSADLGIVVHQHGGGVGVWRDCGDSVGPSAVLSECADDFRERFTGDGLCFDGRGACHSAVYGGGSSGRHFLDHGCF